MWRISWSIPPDPPPATQYLPASYPFGVGAEVGPGPPTPEVGSLNVVGSWIPAPPDPEFVRQHHLLLHLQHHRHQHHYKCLNTYVPTATHPDEELFLSFLGMEIRWPGLQRWIYTRSTATRTTSTSIIAIMTTATSSRCGDWCSEIRVVTFIVIGWNAW